MQLSDIQIHLCQGNGRLRAFCCLSLDNAFVVRDVKVIEGDAGLFLAMPSRRLCDHCPRCHDKNHLRARFCNQCGLRLAEDRATRGGARPKLHADLAHPISCELRGDIEKQVLAAYAREIELSHQPGYVAAPGVDAVTMHSV